MLIQIGKPTLVGVIAFLTVALEAQVGEIDELSDFEITRAATIDHRLLVLPAKSGAGSVNIDGWRLSVAEEGGLRVYRAALGDRVHTARAPVSSNSRVAFNPTSSRFERLAQNLRVELTDTNALDDVVEAAGGTGGKAYPLLGFAFVYLPIEVDPINAAEAIREMPVVSSVRLTVRGPKRKPR